MELTFLVNIAGLVLIAGIVYWFWLSKPAAKSAGDAPITIVVDNGVYEPSRIEMQAGRKYRLEFLRKDPSPCAEKVVFEELGITHDLPLGEPLRVDILAPAAGEYNFTCQMKMYRGVLLVR